MCGATGCWCMRYGHWDMHHLQIRQWMRFDHYFKKKKNSGFLLGNSNTLSLLFPQVVLMFAQSKQYCHPPPPGCPRVIYAIMVDCWWGKRAMCVCGQVCRCAFMLGWWICGVLRNPDHGARPTAGSIVQELSGSHLKLLAMGFAQQLQDPTLELALSANSPTAQPACTLGAPLEEGRTLYQDLQIKYSWTLLDMCCCVCTSD